MSAQVLYANGVIVNYSLTTYSPYEGYQVGINGMKGRLETWEDIPWREQEKLNQAQLHAAEMDQSNQDTAYNEIVLMKNFQDYDMIKVPRPRGGHGGGDVRLQDRIFRDSGAPDPMRHTAGSRDGAMSILIGIAARKSIQLKRSVRISELTDIEPQKRRPDYFKGVKL